MTDPPTLVPADDTGNNDAIPLKEAAKRFGFTLSTLRTEDRRGRLTTYRIGKKLFTRPSDIRRMVEKCRVVRKAQDFTSITDGSNGLSETERTSSALAAAKETVLMLKSASRNTSGTSISPSRRARR